MKKLLLSFGLIVLATTSFTQVLSIKADKSDKPSLQLSEVGKWGLINKYALSNDGKYIAYYILNPYIERSLVVQSLDSRWSFNILSGHVGTFSEDSKYFVFQKKDTLGIINLESHKFELIENMSSFKLSMVDNSSYLAYKLSSNNLVLKNLNTEEEQRFTSISDYLFSPNGEELVLVAQNTNDALEYEVRMINLRRKKQLVLWKGVSASKITFDRRSTQFAFIGVQKLSGGSAKSVWRYRVGDINAEPLVTEESLTQTFSLNLNTQQNLLFSKDGSRLLVTLQEKLKDIPRTNVSVDVFSYRDYKLQSLQLKELQLKNYRVSIGIQKKDIVRLENENETLIGPHNFDSLVLVASTKGDGMSEWNWNQDAKSSIFLVNTSSGERKLIGFDLPFRVIYSYKITPDKKYVVYFNPIQRNYFSYAIKDGVVKNITKEVTANWIGNNDQPDAPFTPLGIAGFTSDSHLLIYDEYDIIKIDPSKIEPPVIITRGFGRKHSIIFRFAIKDYDVIIDELSKSVIVNAFNRLNKDNGFYSIDMTSSKAPVRLTMGPFLFEGTRESSEFTPKLVIKARDANIYVVDRMSAREFPNLFYTKNFNDFIPITDYHPEKNYNWLVSELISWKTLSGTMSQGILYKPENFDPTKKYPLIMHTYERFSEGLNGFSLPDLSRDRINIPYYVSNGYLVFEPDIHFKISNPGQSVLSTVVSAVSHLSKYDWVDKDKIGIQGHSFGGFQVNHIVTHTNLFKAAISAAGMSNFVSAYGSIIADGRSRQRQYELYRDRMGGSLWDIPDLYLQNSPVLFADKVSTPLLIMHNNKDGDVPYSQGIELFTGLRRLKKKAWLLQYDEGDHSVDEKEAHDFTIRMKQFFDHYLKNAPAPIWMTQGIPARLKGVITGYDYDPANNCGKDCKVCKQWNDKMKKDSIGTWKEIEKRKQEEHWQ